MSVGGAQWWRCRLWKPAKAWGLPLLPPSRDSEEGLCSHLQAFMQTGILIIRMYRPCWQIQRCLAVQVLYM